MVDLKKFDKSRRIRYRSDYQLERIHKNLPWNKRRLKWYWIAVGFIVPAATTQAAIWYLNLDI